MTGKITVFVVVRILKDISYPRDLISVLFMNRMQLHEAVFKSN